MNAWQLIPMCIFFVWMFLAWLFNGADEQCCTYCGAPESECSCFDDPL